MQLKCVSEALHVLYEFLGSGLPSTSLEIHNPLMDRPDAKKNPTNKIYESYKPDEKKWFAGKSPVRYNNHPEASEWPLRTEASHLIC